MLSGTCFRRFSLETFKAWRFFSILELGAHFEEIKWSSYVHMHCSEPYTNEEAEKVQKETSEESRWENQTTVKARIQVSEIQI